MPDEQYRFYVDHGICPRCRKQKAVPNRRFCADCLYKLNEAQIQRYRAMTEDDKNEGMNRREYNIKNESPPESACNVGKNLQKRSGKMFRMSYKSKSECFEMPASKGFATTNLIWRRIPLCNLWCRCRKP